MTESTALGNREPFPRPSLADWRALVERDLKGAPYAKKLQTTTLEGLTLDCLYTAEGPGGGLPTSGPSASGIGRPAGQAWRVVARASGPEAGAQVRDELARGADALRLAARGGESAAQLAACCEGVDLSQVDLVLELAGEPLAAAALARAFADIRPDWTSGGVTLDPCAAAAAGSLHAPLDASLARLAPALATLGPRPLRALEVRTAPYHAAGASESQDLGLALAAALELIRHSGLDPAGARARLAFALPLPSELFLAVAKGRALRGLWARAEEVLGLTPAPVFVHAESAWRELSARDPWVNVLRGTATCFAGALGGANSIGLAPWDACLSVASESARRVARNTHTVLREESHLHRVADPAAGSYYLEELTAGLQREAWGFLQAIEAQGGLAAALQSGWLTVQLGEVAAERARRVAKRQITVTGVSDFPLLSEVLPAAPAGAARGLSLTAPPASAAAEALLAAARAGAGLGSLAAALGGAAPTALPRARLAEPFEALRAASDALLLERGARPRAYLAGIGPLAGHTGRSTWIRNLLAAGGIEAVGAEDDEPADLLSDFAQSGARAVVLCGRDVDYARVPELCAGLRAAGASWIGLAGRAGPNEEAWREAGLSASLYLGCDVVAVLNSLLPVVTQ